MMDPHSRYSNLKNVVLEEAGSFFSLDQLKEHFSTPINSRRALSNARSLKCIIRLLEERDILNWRNVETLKQLGELLRNNRILELVQSYKKLYLDETEEELCICGEQISHSPASPPVLSQQLDNRCLTQNSNHINSDLIAAVTNISQRIGRAWPYLARELDVKEYHRDLIGSLHPKNYELQAKTALKLWLQREKENASVEVLARALDARNCVRFGLGSFLLEPM